MGESGRRRYDRYDFSELILLSNHCNNKKNISGRFYYVTAKSVNLNEEGMAFQSSQPLKPGSCLNISLTRPDRGGYCETFQSEVKWCKKRGGKDNRTFFSGVKFIRHLPNQRAG